MPACARVVCVPHNTTVSRRGRDSTAISARIRLSAAHFIAHAYIIICQGCGVGVLHHAIPCQDSRAGVIAPVRVGLSRRRGSPRQTAGMATTPCNHQHIRCSNRPACATPSDRATRGAARPPAVSAQPLRGTAVATSFWVGLHGPLWGLDGRIPRVRLAILKAKVFGRSELDRATEVDRVTALIVDGLVASPRLVRHGLDALERLRAHEHTRQHAKREGTTRCGDGRLRRAGAHAARISRSTSPSLPPRASSLARLCARRKCRRRTPLSRPPTRQIWHCRSPCPHTTARA